MQRLTECLFCGAIRPDVGFKNGIKFETNMGTFYECDDCFQVFYSKGGIALVQSTLLTAGSMIFNGLGRREIRQMAELEPLTTKSAPL